MLISLGYFYNIFNFVALATDIVSTSKRGELPLKFMSSNIPFRQSSVVGLIVYFAYHHQINPR